VRTGELLLKPMNNPALRPRLRRGCCGAAPRRHRTCSQLLDCSRQTACRPMEVKRIFFFAQKTRSVV